MASPTLEELLRLIVIPEDQYALINVPGAEQIGSAYDVGGSRIR